MFNKIKVPRGCQRCGSQEPLRAAIKNDTAGISKKCFAKSLKEIKWLCFACSPEGKQPTDLMGFFHALDSNRDNDSLGG